MQMKIKIWNQEAIAYWNERKYNIVIEHVLLEGIHEYYIEHSSTPLKKMLNTKLIIHNPEYVDGKNEMELICFRIQTEIEIEILINMQWVPGVLCKIEWNQVLNKERHGWRSVIIRNAGTGKQHNMVASVGSFEWT